MASASNKVLDGDDERLGTHQLSVLWHRLTVFLSVELKTLTDYHRGLSKVGSWCGDTIVVWTQPLVGREIQQILLCLVLEKLFLPSLLARSAEVCHLYYMQCCH